MNDNPFDVPDDPNIIIPLDINIEKHAKYWDELMDQKYIIKLENICIFDFTLEQLSELIEISNLNEDCWIFLCTLKSFNDLSDSQLFEVLTKWCPCFEQVWEHPRVVKYLSENYDAIISILENCESGSKNDRSKIVFIKDILTEHDYYNQLDNILEDRPDFNEWIDNLYAKQSRRIIRKATEKGLI